jgi:phage shock protein E
MRLRQRNAVVLALCGLASYLGAAEPTKDSLATVKQNIAEKKAVLVDVREKAEWDAGHLAGAIFLPLSELSGGGKTSVLPKDKIVYTHCVVGKRSLTAANILEKQGYQVRSLKAGYKELLDAGFEKAKP